MGRDNVTKYNEYLVAYNKLSSLSFRDTNKVCGMCFKANCDHNVEKITTEDAGEEVAYWLEVIKMELLTNDLVYDDIYPKWVTPYGKITKRHYYMYPMGNITMEEGVYMVNEEPFVLFKNGLWEPVPRSTIIQDGLLPADTKNGILIPFETLSHEEFFNTAVVVI